MGDPEACARRLAEQIAAVLWERLLGWWEARLRLRAGQILERKLSLPRQRPPENLPGVAVRLLEGLSTAEPASEIVLEVAGIRPLAYDQMDLLGGKKPSARSGSGGSWTR